MNTNVLKDNNYDIELKTSLPIEEFEQILNDTDYESLLQNILSDIENKSKNENLNETMKKYWFTFDDDTEIPAENEEQAIELYSKLWKNRNSKQVRSKEELDKIAQSLYDKRDDEGFYDFNDEELAILWSMCMLRKDGTGGRAYDDEVYDTISLLPHKQKIFDRTEKIVDKEEKSFLTKEQTDKLDKAIANVVNESSEDTKEYFYINETPYGFIEVTYKGYVITINGDEITVNIAGDEVYEKSIDDAVKTIDELDKDPDYHIDTTDFTPRTNMKASSLEWLKKILAQLLDESCKETHRKSLKEADWNDNDEIKIYMNTWANYNENGADLSQYGIDSIADGWLSIDDAIKFAEEHADDEPFINDTDNVPEGFDINEYSSIDVLEDLKEYEDLNDYEKEALSAIMESTGDDFETAKDVLDGGDYQFYKGIDNYTDLAYEIIDELGGLGEAVGDRITSYIDEEAMRRDYEYDVRDQMYDDAENAVEEEHYGEMTQEEFDKLPKEIEIDLELDDYDSEEELNAAIRDEIAYHLDLDFDVDDLETAIESFETETKEDGTLVAKNIVYNFDTYDKDAEIEDWIDSNIDSWLDSIISDELYMAERGEIDLSNYFDYEAFGRDLSFDGYDIVSNGIIIVY